MTFSDIHIHALAGVDDGASSKEEMYRMVDDSYKDGVRLLCLTPHFHPGYFGDNYEKSGKAFQVLTAYVNGKYPDMKLYLGNELRYSQDCLSWLNSGRCRTLNGSRHVLVDFSEMESARTISAGLNQLLNGGYIPILAHAERYRKLDGNHRLIREFRENGVLIQLDTMSLQRQFGFAALFKAKSLLAAHLVDLVGSDAHDLESRVPGISLCYDHIKKKCGEDYAEKVCRKNAESIF